MNIFIANNACDEDCGSWGNLDLIIIKSMIALTDLLTT